MADTYISFYLKNNRIHIFVEALRSMGCPRFVCFMMGDNADTLVLAPYHKKDFHSHRVSQSVYNGKGGLELSSFPLCQMLAAEHGWDINKSYRVPGNLRKKDGVLMVAFNLQMASAIEQ